MKQSLFIIVAAIVLPNVALADPQGDSTPSPCVVILSGTTGNFSPQLGDTATIRVDLTPDPPSGGFSDVYFQCEIIRELNGGGTPQHIAWVDVIPSTQALNESRGADFATLSMIWEGVAGASQEEAEGPESFTGISDSFYRILPKVTGGQYVPPPIYQIAARLRKYSDDSIVCEDVKTIYVKQAVKIDFAGAQDLMQQGLYRNDGVMLMAPLDDFHYDLINSQIMIECYKYYGGQVNIDFGEYSNPHDQYSELDFQSDADVENWGDADDVDFGNANPGQSARVYVGKTRKDIYNQFSYYSEWQTPITPTEIVTGYARTAAHEVGHLLGLTETNGVLGGIAYLGELSLGGPHNRNPWDALNIMDPGNAHAATNGLLYKIGRAGPWTFRSLNQDYLEFVLPH